MNQQKNPKVSGPAPRHDAAEPQMVAPSDGLKQKAGGLKLDESALARAEKAFEDFVEENKAWGDAEVKAMKATFAGATKNPDQARDILKKVYGQSHEIRGMGQTMGYDLLTMMGTSLCDFLTNHPEPSDSVLETVRVHIDSMLLVVTKQQRGDGGEWGQGLMKKLSDYVAENA